VVRPPPDLLARALSGAAPGFLPARASSAAESADRVFGFIFWVSVFFLALILLLTVLFAVRYRMRPSRPGPEPSPAQATGLELLWSGIPLALVVAMFAMSTRAWFEMTAPAPGEAIQVQVTARRWSWWFDHPGGRGSAELHLVAGRPAELVMSSADVVHSLYVPEFRLKQDLVPGRFTRMAFRPTLAGTYPVLCAEYCGTDHSRMSSKVVVHPDQASFDAWAREGVAPDGSLVALGKHVFLQRGCIACHSLDGSRKVGPTVKGIWRKMEKLADGASVLVDEEYLRESVLKPGAKIVAGFPNAMPPIPVEERELKALIAYIQSLAEAR
jgi:cytochrome c oxidase subunit II